MMVGGVLLTAAILKAQRLLTEPALGTGLFESRWFQVLLVEGEVGCGLALALGLWPRITRGAALLLFAAFFGVALAKVLSGARSCACFGNVQVRPWLAVLLDAGLVSALWCCQPAAPATGSHRFALTAGLFALLLFPIALFGFARDKAYPWLEVSPAMIELGNVPQGGRREFALHVRNPQDQSVTIEQVQSSCPCLEARGLPLVLAPGEEGTLAFVLDLAREREFTGRLRIDFRALTAAGATVFSASVQASVAPFPSFTGVSS
jgi:hypothetical protein